MTESAPPTLLVIVGITGDLSRRKLIPSLYHLEQDGLLSDGFKIIGTTRKEVSLESFHDEVEKIIVKSDQKCEDDILKRLLSRLSIETIDMSDSEHYEQLASVLRAKEAEIGTCAPHLFYLAVPPTALPGIVDLIGHTEVHMCSHGKNGRLLIEKPFGKDLASAEELSEIIARHFSEEQIYRIDHYLAKETTQNILHFRFKNPLVRDIWNRKYVDNIQITAAESIGVEGRANFYEQTGALRDMVQSHLLQLLALTTMDKPDELDAEHVRAKREELLMSLKPLKDIDAVSVRGQYTGYREEIGNDKSNVETYVALKAEIDNDNWRDVPIYLRTGKNLKHKATEITLVYKSEEARDKDDINLLTIRIQPNEGIALKLRAKKPGLENLRQDIVMDYCYDESDDKITHTAYEKLLVDAMRGDQMLFPTTEEVINNWRYIAPLIEAWEASDVTPEMYSPKSWGPDGASKILSAHEDRWMQQENDVCQPK